MRMQCLTAVAITEATSSRTPPPPSQPLPLRRKSGSWRRLSNSVASAAAEIAGVALHPRRRVPDAAPGLAEQSFACGCQKKKKLASFIPDLDETHSLTGCRCEKKQMSNNVQLRPLPDDKLRNGAV